MRSHKAHHHPLDLPKGAEPQPVVSPRKDLDRYYYRVVPPPDSNADAGAATATATTITMAAAKYLRRNSAAAVSALTQTRVHQRRAEECRETAGRLEGLLEPQRWWNPWRPCGRRLILEDGSIIHLNLTSWHHNKSKMHHLVAHLTRDGITTVALWNISTRTWDQEAMNATCWISSSSSSL